MGTGGKSARVYSTITTVHNYIRGAAYPMATVLLEYSVHREVVVHRMSVSSIWLRPFQRPDDTVTSGGEHRMAFHWWYGTSMKIDTSTILVSDDYSNIFSSKELSQVYCYTVVFAMPCN